MGDVRVVFAAGNHRLELEGERDFVEAQLAELLPLLSSATLGSPEVDDSSGTLLEAAPVEGEENKRAVSIRRFIEEKAPETSSDAIACILYFFREHRNQPDMTVDEIRQNLLVVKVRPPSNMNQALTDCRRRYAYVEPTKKGSWALAHEGEVRVTLDLPTKKSAE